MNHNNFLSFVKSVLQVATLLILLSTNVFGQCTINWSRTTIPVTSTTTGTQASIATIYDPGGTSNYANSQDVSIAYTVPAGKILKITFTTFVTESGFDYVNVYDGTSSSATAFTTSPGLSGTKTGAALPTYTSSGTSMTVRFKSDGSNVAAGFVASLECLDACVNTTSGGTIAGNQTLCGPATPGAMSSSAAASGGTGAISYQWESSINNTTFTDISGATSVTYTPAAAITQTTYYRRKSKTSTCTVWGLSSNTITKTIVTTPIANAGVDQSQCENSAFFLVANTVLAGQTGTWSVVSGAAITQMNVNEDSIYYNLPVGTSTLRWTVSNAGCSITDDVVITNTTGCSTACVAPLNLNGDLENEGGATTFGLTFQGTPAQLLNDNNTPLSWVEGYGTTVPNSSTFTGAYYIKKTGTESNPHSGTHMIYMAGPGFCYGALNTNASIVCGRTFRVSAWVAAYSNTTTQANSPFAIEVFINDWDNIIPDYKTSLDLLAPASTSWNTLNWQRYYFDVTVPSNAGYDNLNVIFSTANNINGILFDDVCITEISSGARSNAGVDQFGCTNSFTMNANVPPSGYTGTWTVVGGSASISSLNSPTSLITLSSGTVANLRWTVSNGASCPDFDEVVIGKSSGSISVNNASACGGASGTLTASGCTGSLLWSNGATTSSITVSPTSTTTYSVTCTPADGPNLVKNPDFELAGTDDLWDDWGNSALTTTTSEIRTGSKAMKITTGTSGWGGFGQQFSVTPGQKLNSTFWVKTNNVGSYNFIGIRYYDLSYAAIGKRIIIPITAVNYTQYNFSSLVPYGAAIVEIGFEVNDIGTEVLVDDVSVKSTMSCSPTASGTVSVSTTNNITLGTPVVSSRIVHPLMDVATVDVVVSWTSAIAGDKIAVTLGTKTETIDIPAGASSPQTIRFIVPANGSTNNIISATWVNNPACIPQVSFNAPSGNINNQITCDILYLCGDAKPADGDAWDHGFIGYLDEVSTGNITPILTKPDATGMGTYNPEDPSQFITLNLSNYKMIVISPSTEMYVSNDLRAALASYKGGILNMSFTEADPIGMTNGAASYSFQTNVYTDNTTQIPIYNYDNPGSTYDLVYTLANMKAGGTASVWYTSNSASTLNNAINFKYPAHSLSGVSATHGKRVYCGFHPNGIYQNSVNGGALPVPSKFYFHPTKHFTLEGKAYFDQAIVDATSCVQEICNNNIDDDGDGLVDCLDPDCGQISNREFDTDFTDWFTSTTSPAIATYSIDKTSQLSGINSAKINVTTSSSQIWHAQIGQSGKTIESGKTYRITFKAKASTARSINSLIQLGATPWTEYASSNHAVTTSAQTFTYTFVASATINNNILFSINVGTVIGTIWIDDVRFEEVCCIYPTITASTPASRCGAGTVTLGATASAGTINWYAAATGGTSLGTGTSFTTPSLSATTTYYIDATNGSCNTPTRTSVVATINSAAPTISTTTPASRCGTGTVTLGAVASAGTINWYAASTGGTSLGTGTSYTTASISATTTYYVDATNGSCTTATRTAVAATINAIPTISATTPASRCGTGTVTLGATASAGTINWYAASTGGTSLGTGTSFTTPSISATTTYYVDATNSGCTTATRTAVAATINAIPTISATTPASRCGTGTVTLGATASAGTINWYAASTGGTSLGTGTSYTTASISTTTTYYVDATNSGCTTATRTSVDATINAIPTISATTPASRCGTGTLTLGATASSGTINWYAASTGGTSLGTGTSYTTASISATTTYYVDATNSGCTTATRTTVAATVNAIPTISATTPSSRCGTGTVTLGATASAGTINWYAASTGGTSLGTGTSYTTASISATTTYYVDATNSGCTTATRTAVAATINAIPTISATTPASRCGTGTVTLGATASAGTINWYAASTGGTSLGTGTSYTTASISATTTYYVDATNSGCTTATRTSVDATINAISTISATTPASRCGTGTVTLGATASAGTINWYAASTGGTSLGTGTSYTTASISATTTYYVDATNSGCTTTTRTAVAATINSCTEICGNNADDDADGLIDCLDSDCIETQNREFDSGFGDWENWVDPSVSATVSIDNTNQLSGQNSVKIVVNSTPGTSWLASLYQYNMSIFAGKTYEISFLAKASVDRTMELAVFEQVAPYANFVNQTINLSTTQQQYKFYYTTTISYLDVVKMVFHLAGSPGTVWIDNIILKETCCSSVISSTTPASRCGTGTVTLGATASAGTINWYATPTGGTSLGTGTSFTTPAISSTTTYYVDATFGGCTTDSRTAVIANVIAKPTTSISGASTSLCIGGTTNITPSTAGTWTSSNTAIATITNAGLITAIAAGSATFSYTLTSNGCVSDATASFTVNAKPSVSITGSATICAGSTTNLSPTSGGTWASSNSAVATITSGGVVTGVAAGTATFTFTNNTTLCPSDATSAVTVNGKPTTSISGASTSLCIGGSTNITPSTAGTWTSSNAAVATITNAGLITAVAAGSATFTYTLTSNSCTSDATSSFTVNAKPNVSITGSATICAGSTTNLSPTTGGTWVSSNTSVATVTNGGVVTGIAAGTATFTFTNSTTLCPSNATSAVTVNAKPTTSISGASTSLCIGGTTNITPSTAGTWTSSNTSVATITNVGLITAVSAGSATFTYTLTSNSCTSDATASFTVNAKPSVSITGSATICAGSTTNLSPTTGGTWVSSNTSVATITSGGVVTGVAAGTATFTFTNSTTLCPSDATSTVTVNAKPTTSISGANASLCIGGTTNITPSMAGTWTSSNTSVATITNAGLITAVAAGSAIFTYTLTSNSCTSDATASFTVNAKPSVSITGSATICAGSTTNLSPTTGGTWTSSNTALATITSGGVVTGVAAGTATFTFTNSTTLCPSDATSAVTVNAKPTTSISGASASLCIGGTTNITPSTAGTWTSSNTAVATISNAGLITAIAAGSATFTYTLTSNSCTSDATASFTVRAKPSVSITGGSTICAGSTTNLSPTTGGTWASSNTAVATVTSGGVVTGVAAGTATFTFTNSTTLCPSDVTNVVTVNGKSTISGAANICKNNTTTLSSSSTGTWSSSNSAVASINNSGLVTGVSAGSAVMTFTNGNGCVSDQTLNINVGNLVSAAIDYNGSVCLNASSQLSALATGGTSPFTYQWTGPSSLTSSLQTVAINNNGNYYLTISDSYGCVSSTSGFVYSQYVPILVSLQTVVCEGNSVNLNVSGTHTAYQWSANAGSATTAAVTVTPAYPSSNYVVTVTNSLGCTASLNAVINVNAKPLISVSGATSICEGLTTSLTPTTGGTWASSDNAIATVNNAGLVTGLSAGNVTFVYTQTSTSCTSDATVPITINAKPIVSILGSNAICRESTTQLSPSSGGTWVSNNPTKASVTNAGVVTGLSAGTATFTFTKTSTGCNSNATAAVTVDEKDGASISGTNTICTGNTSQLSASKNGGIWSSSNTSIATISSTGLVTAISAGNAIIQYDHNSGSCPNEATYAIIVNAKPSANFTGLSSICQGLTSTLSPTSGGTWVSSNSSVASISNAGLVTGLTAGTASFTFTESSTGCTSNASGNITIKTKPTISNSGLSNLCLSGTTVFTPASGGSWTSSNNAVASITSSGLVTALGAGNANFVFTNATTGCSSNASSDVSVAPQLISTIDFNGSPCLKSNSSITALSSGGAGTLTYAWSGPSSFTGNTQTVSINANGNYTVTVTDAYGCSLTRNGFVYEEFVPIMIGLQSTICEGQSINLSANGNNITAYQWSSNASSSTAQNVTVTPSYPSSLYIVTVTNNNSCTASISANINVNQKPVVSLLGPSSICLGETTSLSPTSGGSWTSNNNSIASINSSGIVTAVSAGKATFTFTYSSTGCVSLASDTISVVTKPNVSVIGSSNICLGQTTTLSPTSGGLWTSSNNVIATVTNQGIVTGISDGSVNFTFSNSSSGCSATLSTPIVVKTKPTVVINGPASVCVGSTTNLLPSIGGTWVSNNPSLASINNLGVVTTILDGMPTFTYTEISGCASDPIGVTIKPLPSINITGPTTLCVGANSSLTPTSNGLWNSTNESVATVSNVGTVTAISPGNATFKFTSAINGCTSLETINFTVNPNPITTISGPSNLCVGNTTNFSPSSGGTWTSNNPAIATIANDGTVTTLSQGLATFKFTNNAGCVSQNTTSITINPKPYTILLGDQNICKGATTNFSPSSGGLWSSNNPTIAIISNTGLVTGVSSGSATFKFTESSTSCVSENTIPINVLVNPTVGFSGSTNICQGSTTNLFPTTGGYWTSSNVSIATVSSNGTVTSVSNGEAYFTFTSYATGCQATTTPLTIHEKPTINITGANAFCIGSTSSLSPTTGGTWISNNPSIASISNTGVITGLAVGTATFNFTLSSTGCSSNSNNVTIYSKPNININGGNNICINTNTTLSPNAGGTWISNNPTIATITNAGIVTGLTSGTATFTYTESSSGCVSNESSPVTVNPKPTISISGPSTICIGASTTMLPSVGGSWISNNPSIASITNQGVITGVAQGIVSFTFVSALGCSSNPSNLINVNGKPSIFLNGPSSICVGTNTNLTPASGGVWSSNNPAVAIINNSGLVTGISQGATTFSFTDNSTGCTSILQSQIIVNSNPNGTISGPNILCVGNTTSLLPSTGGTWTSSNPSVANVGNNGQVTGVAGGVATFIFTSTQTGCSTNPNDISLTINPKPIVTLTGASNICAGNSTSFSASGSGTWQSKNPTIASINNSGIVTGLTPGNAKFTFTNSTTGCISPLSTGITVNPSPLAILQGSSNICVGTTTQLLPSSGGTWTSSNPTIASISNSGLVTGLQIGNATFSFTENATNCTSQNSLIVNVVESASASIDGPTTLCIGQGTSLLPATGGVWVSSNNKIATVNNQGQVLAKAPGKTTFTFTNFAGCTSSLPLDLVTVVSCTDPDFNVTMVNKLVSGNVQTNDDFPIIALNRSTNQITYTQPILISKPSESAATINLNADGTYTFLANKAGQYIYNVGVCNTSTDCYYVNLTVTVIDEKETLPKLVANTDIISTYINSPVPMNTMNNDKCINAMTCLLQDNQMNIFAQAHNGWSVKLNDGWSSYTPNPNFIGVDSLWYKVCSNESPSICRYGMQLVTIKDISAINSVVGADDFFAIYQDTFIVGNIMQNDHDAEGDNMIITPQGSEANPLIIAQGSYYLKANGDFRFMPNAGFSGPLEIVYTVCDNNTDQSCTDATIHMLILPDMKLKIKVYLEGSLMQTGNDFTATGKPRMRDNLRANPFNGANVIPVKNPYTIVNPTANLAGQFENIVFGDGSQFEQIIDSAGVFSVTGDNAIVDWVFVEIRDKTNVLNRLACRPALLQRDGDVVEIDGISEVGFPRLNADSFYVVIRHRNHLGAMSKLVTQTSLVDFTATTFPVFDFGTSLGNGRDYSGLATNNLIKPGYRALWGGDFDSNGQLKFTNPGDDQNVLFFDVFSSENNLTGNSNYNFAIGYYQGDYNMNGKSKYDNPDDDKNLLFSQILLYQLNDQFLSNFNFFIEQVPK